MSDVLDAEVPLSEILDKIRAAQPREVMIAELRAIAEAEPEKVITRNYFRNASRFAESVWSAHFGTFQEFKRQANITLSRHAHRMELDVAKHASLTQFREMNIDRAGWEDAYLKPTGKRFQTVLVCSDVHDRECDPFWRHCFVDTARRVQPDVIVFNGDIFDLPEFGKYNVDPRTWDVVGRIKWVHQFLADLREACPDAEFIFIEGNHEYRLLRHLAEESPAMRAVLSDLHGFTLPKLLGLDAFEVNYIARGDLGTFTKADVKGEVSKNYWVGFNSVIAHHFPEGRNMGMPGWNGHHHQHLVWGGYSPNYGSYEWHQLGAGHMRAAEYTAGEKWSVGFALVHIDTQRHRSNFEYITIQDHAVIGGKWYERQASEIVHLS